MHLLKPSILLIVLTFLNIDLFASILPISLEQRIEQSTQIVIGKVIGKNCFWDEGKKNIYTSYTIIVDAYLKEKQTENSIELLVLGGIIGDEAQITYPNFSLAPNKKHLFFLQQDQTFLSRTLNSNILMQFQPFGYIQGVLPSHNNEYIDYKNSSPIRESTILKKIENQVQFKAKTPNGEKYVAFENPPFITPHFKQAVILKNGNNEITTRFLAGTIPDEQDLIIEGTGFGSTPGIVQFSNIDFGGYGFISSSYESDLISWTDTKIRLKIPEKASTGAVQIIHNNGTMVGQHSIIIDWVISPIYSTYRGFDIKTRQRVELLDKNNQGGYTLQVNNSTGILSNPEALTAFETALEEWQCKTGVNFILDKTGTPHAFANDGICVMEYSDDLPIGVVGIATSRYKAVANSSCSEHQTLWFLKEFDIRFRSPATIPTGYQWNFSTEPPSNKEFDFQSIALHELGHVIGLGHVADQEEVMYYTITAGQPKRKLGKNPIDAGLFKMNDSTHPNCLSSQTPMKSLLVHCSTETTQAPATTLKLWLEGFYSSQSELMSSTLLTKDLVPKNQPFQMAPYHYLGEESVSSFPAGTIDWVLLQLRDSDDRSKVVYQKAVLLRDDGQIINETGETIITFKDLEAGNYHIAIFHKSHLPLISSTPHPIEITPKLYDFTNLNENSSSNTSYKIKNNVSMMYSGDFDSNGVINNQDFNLWQQNSAAINLYSPADADGNGIINNLDFNLWSTNRSKVSVISLGGN